jgi:AraC-like DNA-binding protein
MTQMINTLDVARLREPGQPGVDVHRITNHGAGLPHDHIFHELVYVESGTADHKTPTGTDRLRPGDVIVIQPMVWHSYVAPKNLTIINCLIDSRVMRRCWPLLSRVPGAVDLLHVRPRHQAGPIVLHAPPAQQHAIRDRLAAVMTELREQRDGWQAGAVVGVLDVLIMTARIRLGQGRRESVVAVSNRAEQAVLDAVSYIETHLDQQLHLPAIAGHVHFSAAHLGRSFTRRMGMGIIAFQHRLRSEEACRLLRTTDMDITAVAGQLGYGEVAYFSRCFRKHIGVSPSAYRKQRMTT